MNLVGNLAASAEKYPDHVAIRVDDVELSYAGLWDAAARMAGWLSDLGIRPGDRVVVALPNIEQLPVVYYGVLHAGAVVVPTNPLAQARDLAHVLHDSGALALVAWDRVVEEAGAAAADAGVAMLEVDPRTFAAQLAAHAPVAPVGRTAEDTAVVLYTSGTAGSPKGAELSHANLHANAAVCASETLLGIRSEDVVLGGVPLFDALGQACVLNAAVLVGATLTLLPSFEPTRALEIVERDRVTLLAGVPTTYVALAHAANAGEFDTSTLRRCVSGGGTLPAEVLRSFEEVYSVPVLEGYGRSATSALVCVNHADRERKPGSIGQPVAGVSMKLLDRDGNEALEGQVGEIAVAGAHVMKGYLDYPEATQVVLRDGWFRTGDLARRDAEGYYFLERGIAVA